MAKQPEAEYQGDAVLIGRSNKDGMVRMNQWVGFTLSGLVGFAAALVTITLSFSNTTHAAAAAERSAALNAAVITNDVQPRLRALEAQRAADVEWKGSVIKALERIERRLEAGAPPK